MKNPPPVLHALGHALLVLAYITGVASLMFNGQRLFGDQKSFLIPIAMLSLFVLSATIVGTLVLGKPILLYVDGKKSEGLKFFGYTVAWLLALTIALFTALALKNI